MQWAPISWVPRPTNDASTDSYNFSFEGEDFIHISEQKDMKVNVEEPQSAIEEPESAIEEMKMETNNKKTKKKKKTAKIGRTRFEILCFYFQSYPAKQVLAL